MAWIESHQTLGNHPKTRRLARLLSVGRVCAVGHLHFLWWWCLDYADDGDVTDVDAADLADASGWEGDAATFVEALIAAGFVDRVDGRLVVHDWQDYGGKWQDQRRRNADRQREWRQRNATVTTQSQDRNSDVTPTLPLRNTPTVQYSTEDKRTVVNPPPTPPVAPPVEPVPERAPSPPPAQSVERPTKALKEPAAFTAFYVAYPRRVGRPDALRAWLALKPTGEQADAIIGSLAGWQRSADWTKDGGQFIPHPATFLRRRQWEDEPTIHAPPARSNGRPSTLDNIREAFGWQTPAEEGSNGHHSEPAASRVIAVAGRLAAPGTDARGNPSTGSRLLRAASRPDPSRVDDGGTDGDTDWPPLPGTG